MQAKPGVIDFLNSALTTELTAISQYFVQSEMCGSWGYEALKTRMREISMEEMEDAQELISHIIFLEGVPNMQRLNQIQVGENVLENFQINLALEIAAANDLREGITHCTQVGDYRTRRMFEKMLDGEEGHVDYFETQLQTIEQIGLENYLSQQLK